MKKEKSPSNEQVQKKREAYQKYQLENEALLKKYGLETRIVVSFPVFYKGKFLGMRDKIPFFGKIAIWILSKYKVIFDTQVKL